MVLARFANAASADPLFVGDESFAGLPLSGGGDPHDHSSVDIVPGASRSWIHPLDREWT